MKAFVFAMTLVLASISSASNSMLFEIKNPQFNPNHLSGPFSRGTVLVNYDQKTVHVDVNASMPLCRPGARCPQVMPKPLTVELPITAVETDSCGVKYVTASKDQRPVDGILKQVKLMDASATHCQYFVPLVQTFTYTTAGVNRLEGKEFKYVSKATLDLVSDSKEENMEPEFVLAESKLENFPELEIATGAKLTLDPKTVSLSVSIGLNCLQDAPCPAYMPNPILAKMKILSVQQSFCGDTIIARDTSQTIDGRKTQEVKIVDYRNATCEIVIPHLITVDYREVHKGPTGNGFSQKAYLSFDLKK